MRVCSDFGKAGVDAHVLDGQAIDQIGDPLAELVNGKLFCAPAAFRDDFLDLNNLVCLLDDFGADSTLVFLVLAHVDDAAITLKEIKSLNYD